MRSSLIAKSQTEKEEIGIIKMRLATTLCTWSKLKCRRNASCAQFVDQDTLCETSDRQAVMVHAMIARALATGYRRFAVQEIAQLVNSKKLPVSAVLKAILVCSEGLKSLCTEFRYRNSRTWQPHHSNTRARVALSIQLFSPWVLCFSTRHCNIFRILVVVAVVGVTALSRFASL